MTLSTDLQKTKICQRLYKTRKRDMNLRHLDSAERRASDKSLISSIPPRCVKENVSFVIDTNKLKSVNDILVDYTRGLVE